MYCFSLYMLLFLSLLATVSLFTCYCFSLCLLLFLSLLATVSLFTCYCFSLYLLLFLSLLATVSLFTCYCFSLYLLLFLHLLATVSFFIVMFSFNVSCCCYEGCICFAIIKLFMAHIFYATYHECIWFFISFFW